MPEIHKQIGPAIFQVFEKNEGRRKDVAAFEVAELEPDRLPAVLAASGYSFAQILFMK